MAVIFNSDPKFAGYQEAYTGKGAMVSFDVAGANAASGFMVQQYTAVIARQVGMLRFLNVDGVVAQCGAPQGTVTLTGLIGTKDAFDALLKSTPVCGNGLTITIKGTTGFTACSGSGTASNAEEITLIASGAILQNVSVTGQSDSNGVILQTANITFQISGLKTGGA